MHGLLWEVGIADFIIVTLVLGGGAAYMTGRAVASGWEPLIRAIIWMVPLSAAVRFIHFAMFQGTLLSLQFYAVDLIVLTLFAVLGFRLTRRRQMVRGYGWAMEASGPFSWRLKSGQKA